MKTIITLNGVKVTKNIPTSWREVTFRQYIELLKADSKFPTLLSVFTGIDKETIERASIKNRDQLLSMLSFRTKEIPQELPTTCLGYPIVKNLESESIAQAADVEDIYTKFDKDNQISNLEKYPLIVSTYISPEWFGEGYNFQQAEQISNQFFDAPCTEVLAIGNFSYANWIALVSGTSRNSHRGVILLNKLKRGTINWLRYLGYAIRYYFWKRSLPSPVRNFLNGL